MQAKEDYEREQRRKERCIESGESSWMLPSLSERLTAEEESIDKVGFVEMIASKHVICLNFHLNCLFTMDCKGLCGDKMKLSKQINSVT